jgi:hypothetical protein
VALYSYELEASHRNSKTIIGAACFAATDAAATRIKQPDICITFTCVLYLLLFYCTVW